MIAELELAGVAARAVNCTTAPVHPPQNVLSESAALGGTGAPASGTSRYVTSLRQRSRLAKARHPLVDLVFVEPPIRANPEGWELLSPKKLVNRARMHLEILGHFFNRHNHSWCV